MMLYTAFDRVLWVLFLALLLALPLPFGSFDGFYWAFFGFCTVALLGCFLLVQLFRAEPSFRGLKHARWVLLPMALQAVYVLGQRLVETGAQYSVNAPLWLANTPEFWTLQPGATVAWLAKFVLYFTFFVLALCLINSRSRIKAAIYCIVLSAVFHSLLGILSKIQAIHLVPLASVDGHFDVSRGLFVNRNHFAALLNYGLAMLMVSAFYSLYQRKSTAIGWRQYARSMLDAVLSYRLAWWGVLAVLLLGLNFSTSRAGLLGFVGASGLIAVYLALFDKKLSGALRLYGLLMLTVAVVVVVGGGAGVLQRVADGTLSIGERGEQWRQTWEIIRQQWLLGSGAGTYADAFQLHRSLDSLRQLVYDQSHNMYLHNWLEQGLVGMVLWLGSYAAIFICLIRGYRSTGSNYVKAVVLGCLLALLMALLQAAVDFNLLIPALKAYFYCIAAIGFAAISLYRDNDTQ